MGQMAGHVRELGERLQSDKASPQQSRLQGIYDLPQLCPRNTIDDIHNQLDRAVKPRFQTGYAHEDSYAQRRICTDLNGQRSYGP